MKNTFCSLGAIFGVLLLVHPALAEVENQNVNDDKVISPFQPKFLEMKQNIENKEIGEGHVVAENRQAENGQMPWDVNGDFLVNIYDLVLVGLDFGKAGDNITGDINGDKTVDILDLTLVGHHFGETRDVDAIIKDLSNRDIGIATKAITALGEIGGSKAVSALFGVVDNNVSILQFDALEALEKIGTRLKKTGEDDQLLEQIVLGLAHRLNGADYRTKGGQIIYTLGKIGDSRAVSTLVRLLGPYWTIFSEIDPETGQEKIIRFVPKKETWYEVSDVIVALGRIGDASAIDPLIKMAAIDEVGWAWNDVVDALAKINKASSNNFMALVEHLENPDAYVRILVIKVLGGIGDPRAIPILKKIATDEKESYYIREEARYSLLKLGVEIPEIPSPF